MLSDARFHTFNKNAAKQIGIHVPGPLHKI